MTVDRTAPQIGRPADLLAPWMALSVPVADATSGIAEGTVVVDDELVAGGISFLRSIAGDQLRFKAAHGWTRGKAHTWRVRVVDHLGNVSQREGRVRIMGLARCGGTVRGVRTVEVRDGDCSAVMSRLRRWTAHRAGRVGPADWRCRAVGRRVSCRLAAGVRVSYRLLKRAQARRTAGAGRRA